MSEVAVERWVSPEEYLAFERTASERHEYINGEIYAMAGTSFDHERIAQNLYFLVTGHLRGRPCESFGSEVRVHNPASGSFVYPDLSVVCGDLEATDSVLDTLKNPLVIVEILSTLTEAFDRGDKFAHYRLLDSLEAYVLVSQREARVEVYTRRGDRWEMQEFIGLDSVFVIETIEFSAPLSEVYRRVKFPDPEPPAPTPPIRIRE